MLDHSLRLGADFFAQPTEAVATQLLGKALVSVLPDGPRISISRSQELPLRWFIDGQLFVSGLARGPFAGALLALQRGFGQHLKLMQVPGITASMIDSPVDIDRSPGHPTIRDRSPDGTADAAVAWRTGGPVDAPDTRRFAYCDARVRSTAEESQDCLDGSKSTSHLAR